MNPYLDLYLTFARIGVCTFGGGYAMLPILQREVVEKRHWATEDELMDYYAIGQCTPGVIAVNTSTFIGYKTHDHCRIYPAVCASRCRAARICRNPHRGLRACAAVRVENGEKGRC